MCEQGHGKAGVRASAQQAPRSGVHIRGVPSAIQGEHQIPESLRSWNDEMGVGRVAVAPRHLHRAGAVPVDRCQRKGQQTHLLKGHRKTAKPGNSMKIRRGLVLLVTKTSLFCEKII